MKGWQGGRSFEFCQVCFLQVGAKLAESKVREIGWFRGEGSDLQRMGVVKCRLQR